MWYRVNGTRKCPRNVNSTEIDPDNTCLPNEKCIDGACKSKLWAGEYGCESDLQCQSRCPNTYCEQKSDKQNLTQCQCSNSSLLLYGRCCESFHKNSCHYVKNIRMFSSNMPKRIPRKRSLLSTRR